MLVVAACARPSAPPTAAPNEGSESPRGAADTTSEPPDEASALADDERSFRPPGTIFRSEIDRALARGPGYLLYELGPEPYRMSGRFVGWEITRVFPDEPGLCTDGCDLMVGDIILSVNGDRLETPQAFSNMIDALPRLEALTIKSIRDEQRRVVTYALREG